MKKIIKSINAPNPVGPYSQAVLIDGTLFISGQVAIDMETKVLFTDNIETETKIVMKNIESILSEAGFSFQNVVKSTIFTVDLNNFSIINKVYGGFFESKTAPARETVEVSALPLGANVEISVIAKK
ncbi:MAG: reactive intermediate/imine deaminase [Flavobacteriaceae bacterium]|nr:reactive intermediate/imine deaminase [Flavobacteriaceae bacterium]